MKGCSSAGADVYWSESVPSAPTCVEQDVRGGGVRVALGSLEEPGTGAAGRVIHDVRAGLVHALGDDLRLGGVVEPAEVRRLGDVGVVDRDARVDRLRARVEPCLE